MIVTGLLSSIIALILAALSTSDALSILSAILSALTLIGGFITFLLGKDADKKKVVGFGALLCAVVFFAGFVGLRALNPPQHEWKQVVKQFEPGCRGGSWKVVGGDVTPFHCSGHGLLVQQPLNDQHRMYYEIDLEKVNENTYSQTTFKVQVHVKFQSSDGQNTADPAALANVSVQRLSPTMAAGYIFGVNNTGYWELKSVKTFPVGNTVGVVDIVIESGSVQIDRSQAIALEVDVQNNKLLALINGQQVVEQDDPLNPSSGVVGLRSEWKNNNSTTEVLYRDFELDL